MNDAKCQYYFIPNCLTPNLYDTKVLGSYCLEQAAGQRAGGYVRESRCSEHGSGGSCRIVLLYLNAPGAVEAVPRKRYRLWESSFCTQLCGMRIGICRRLALRVVLRITARFEFLPCTELQRTARVCGDCEITRGVGQNWIQKGRTHRQNFIDTNSRPNA